MVTIGLAASASLIAWFGAAAQLGPASGAAAVALLAALAALLPMASAHRGPAQVLVMRALSGTIIRMFVTAMGLLLLTAGLGLERVATSLWTLGWYATLLCVEVFILASYFRSLPGALGGRGGNDPNATARVETPLC
ncbi:MAG: hypothetical protein WD009_12650 [Phycisphaeraceae bacterium]